MYNCEICGRKIKKKTYGDGKILCSKHWHQWYNYGRFLDSNPRTRNDLNKYRICGDEVVFDLYNGVTSEKIGEFIIDLEDIEKVKYHKWRYSHSHIVTGLPAKGTQRDLSWVILGLDNRDEANKGIVIDHINGDPNNNKKNNLRICSQSQNVLNKSFMSNNTSGFIGVSYHKDRDRYDPEIRLQKQRCHLGYTKTLEEAVYKRYYAEQILFKEFANEAEQEKKRFFTEKLPQEIKTQLQQIVEEKLKAKGLWQ